MKTMKYVKPYWVILLLSALLSACADDQDTRNTGNGDGKTLRISISAPEQKIVSPLTKSNKGLAESVENLWVLIYDQGGSLLQGSDKSFYVPSGELRTNDLGAIIYQKTIELPENPTGNIVVVANAGQEFAGQVTTFSKLQDYKFALKSKNPEFIMYYGKDFDLTKSTDVKAELVRIYSMITVVVNPTGLKQGVTVTPISLELKNVPNTGKLVPTNVIGGNGVSSVENAEKIERIGTEANFLNETNAHALFLYENVKGKGANTGTHKDDQTYKTPPGMAPTADKKTVFDSPESKSCSYIEIKAQYQNDNTGQAGIIAYRFFLGYDATNDFTVERNVHYSITMKLNGSGGEDEVSWRVDYDYLKNITAQDVYMSYRASSTARMYLDDVEDYVNKTDGREIIIDATGPSDFTNWPVGINKYFEILGAQGQQIKYDTEKKKYYIEIRTNITNIHDYENKQGEVTFTLRSSNMPGIALTCKANITQVPRLVDPIAYYKAAGNTNATEIVVKEFDAKQTPGKYVTLRSISKDNNGEDGTWSVEIVNSTDGAWFKLARNENELSKGVSGVKGKISGTGEVKFWYQPVGVNTGSPRFAKLTVRYHDEDCMHDIFLRQGYAPIALGDENRAWSSFNCLGTTSLFAGDNEYGKETEYPTQTGWLFNGGVDRAMHPFIPGHRTGTTLNGSIGKNEYEQIEYSDNQRYYYQDVTKKINDEIFNINATDPWTHWQERGITNESNRTPSKKGPCPQGYVVADAFDYLKMINTTEVYTGYVHDDDPVSGWTYQSLSNGQPVDVDGSNHCNPAKGALFVEREGCTNLFFNFGKGVLRKQKATSRDPKLLEEIGIGHRYAEGTGLYGYGPNYATFAQLTYEEAGSLIWTTGTSSRSESYGAYYWNATPFSDHRNNMGKVDFGYNVFSTYPYLIDVPGRSVTGDGASGEARGINLYQNASFVRCVRAK